jgi:hypothetical protein
MLAGTGHTRNKQNSHSKPNRRNQVNRLQHIQEARTEYSSRHVAQATDVHEQVTKYVRSIVVGKEATGQQ